MQKNINQAEHNQDFHKCIVDKFEDSFFDWKITVLFYIAIHYLKALAEKRGENIGDTHIEIDRSVNPDRNDSTMKITRNAWREYKQLYNYSRTARYEGITDFDTFNKLKEIDHKYCLEHVKRFKAYIKGQKVPIGE